MSKLLACCYLHTYQVTVAMLCGGCVLRLNPVPVLTCGSRHAVLCRSFTLGQHYRHQHHISSSSNHSSRSSLTPSQHGTSSHHSTASHAGLGAKPRQGSQHMPAKQQAHIAANGRRSPLQHSQHPAAAVNSKLPGQATGHVRPAGVLAGDFDSKAAAAAAPSGLGGSLVPKLQRVMSESVRPEAIAKGFAGRCGASKRKYEESTWAMD